MPSNEHFTVKNGKLDRLKTGKERPIISIFADRIDPEELALRTNKFIKELDDEGFTVSSIRVEGWKTKRKNG